MKMKNLSSRGALVLDVTDIQCKLLGNTVNIISAVFVLDLTLRFILIIFISRLLSAVMICLDDMDIILRFILIETVVCRDDLSGRYGYKTAACFNSIYIKTAICLDDNEIIYKSLNDVLINQIFIVLYFRFSSYF